MNTAEQWVDGEDGLMNLTSSYEADHTREELIDFVSKIQQDARAEILEDLERIKQIQLERNER